ncbi:hypothetical protein C8R45DRAFT_1032314 [Mycena sanguinolenta]|nr:hypothetical protein C8R45DRAFT_1032314 [Mycena sanguinolenta]
MTHNASDSKPPPPYDARNMRATKKETAVSEPRYVHYRVYCPDGAIPSKTAFNPRDPYVGRILARSVPPPHNAATLKRCFAKAENIADPLWDERFHLYRDHDASSNLLPGAEQVVILGPAADGVTPDSAFALVLQTDLSADEEAAVASIDLSCRREDEPKYLYYRLFTQTREDSSKVSFNSNEPALGRVERILISPPRTPTCITRHIAKVERSPEYASSDFYENISAQKPTHRRICLPLMRNNSVGLTEEEPIVLVCSKP